jgi:hypothetical protein
LEAEFLFASVGRDLVARLVDRAEREGGAVIVRQYCRIVGRFGDRAVAERLIQRVLDIVSRDPVQNSDNNETYINYYYGLESACAALLGHLATVEAKYDRKLHIYVLGQIGDLRHCLELEALMTKWTDGEHVAMAETAVRAIRGRKG